LPLAINRAEDDPVMDANLCQRRAKQLAEPWASGIRHVAHRSLLVDLLADPACGRLR
jgi:hypothetical protein